jgi:hypothetical protein
MTLPRRSCTRLDAPPDKNHTPSPIARRPSVRPRARDPADLHIAIEDVPAFLMAVLFAAAGEGAMPHDSATGDGVQILNPWGWTWQGYGTLLVYPYRFVGIMVLKASSPAGVMQ